MIRPLRLLADDLTGALDAAAPFASLEQPVEVPWGLVPARTGGGVAATSESRNSGREEAMRRTLDTFAGLQTGVPEALWFKKVDSVLRGHPVAETAALFRAGGFCRCIFAPAFPEMGRVTRRGRQIVIGSDGDRHVGPTDLVGAFAEEGLTAQIGLASDAAVTIIDAETSCDLIAATRALVASNGTLWAGSRGLAAALAGPSTMRPVPTVGAIIVGTSHLVTRDQVRAVEGRVSRARPEGPLTLYPAKPVLIDPVPEAADAVGTQSVLLDALRRLEPTSDKQVGLIVVGGDTLSTVLAATETEALYVLGEVRPGVPLVRAIGGRLNGHHFVTKSGGFGSPELLVSLLSGTSLCKGR